jgi:putative ABC transport system ATP-binding protein
MAQKLEFLDLCPDTLPTHATGFSQIWNLHVSFQKGEQVLVTAPSGKGKSTFISILYGLRNDYKGKYLVDGLPSEEFSKARWSDLRTKEIGIVFQDLRLFMDHTALENLEIKSNLGGPANDRNSMYQMAEILGVEPLLKKKCGQLSFGERQRFAIIRSLLYPVDFLIMDEPFSHLDDANTAKAMELIQNEAIKNGSGLIITSLGDDFGWEYDRIQVL